MNDFQNFVNEERSRLTKKRAELEAQVKDLQTAIQGVDHELKAIAAYEQARSGKPATKPAVRGSRRDQIIAILKDNPGIEPKDIIAKMGGSFHKGGIHTLLSAMKKDGLIVAEDGKYRLA